MPAIPERLSLAPARSGSTQHVDRPCERQPRQRDEGLRDDGCGQLPGQQLHGLGEPDDLPRCEPEPQLQLEIRHGAGMGRRLRRRRDGGRRIRQLDEAATINYPGVHDRPVGRSACGTPGFADGQPVFTGTSASGYQTFSGSLSAYANQRVRIRFLFSSDRPPTRPVGSSTTSRSPARSCRDPARRISAREWSATTISPVRRTVVTGERSMCLHAGATSRRSRQQSRGGKEWCPGGHLLE
jgi:hypothetical protein